MQDAHVCPRCKKPSLAMAIFGAKICGICEREHKQADRSTEALAAMQQEGRDRG